MISKAFATLFAAVYAMLSRFTGQVRRTAAECTDARLNHG
jgi:hypothetical protein